MATYDEVMTALRNADKAGDKEAATRLAQIASQMAGQAKKVDYGFGSAMLQGLSFGFSDAYFTCNTFNTRSKIF